ncbi:hypothetical protein ACSFB8_03650 [Enterococcus faecalis]
MEDSKKLKKRYTLFYRIYMITSFIPLLLLFQLGIYFYLTKFREYVTFSHLFLLVLLLLFVVYLRLNAFHYQKILIMLTVAEKNQLIEKKERNKKAAVRREQIRK